MQTINTILNPHSLVGVKFTNIKISYSPGWKDNSMPFQSIIERVVPVLQTKIISKKLDYSTLDFQLENPLWFKTNEDLSKLIKALSIQGQVVSFGFSAKDTFYNISFSNVSFSEAIKLLLESPIISDFRFFVFDERSLRCNVRCVVPVKYQQLFPGVKYYTKSITGEEYLSNSHLFLRESSYITLRHSEQDVIVGKVLELNELEDFYHSFDRLVLLIQAWDGKNLYITVR